MNSTSTRGLGIELAARQLAVLDLDDTCYPSACASNDPGETPRPLTNVLSLLVRDPVPLLPVIITGQPFVVARKFANHHWPGQEWLCITEHGSAVYDCNDQMHLLGDPIEAAVFDRAKHVAARMFTELGAAVVRINNFTLNAFWDNPADFATAQARFANAVETFWTEFQAELDAHYANTRTSQDAMAHEATDAPQTVPNARELLQFPELNPGDMSGNLWPKTIGKDLGIQWLLNHGAAITIAAGDSAGDGCMLRKAAWPIATFGEHATEPNATLCAIVENTDGGHIAKRPHGHGLTEGLLQYFSQLGAA